MTAAIGVLSVRVRVEEKQILTALTDAGALASHVPHASLPLPPGPALDDLTALGAVSASGDAVVPTVMIDRIPNRAIGRVMNRLIRHAGVQVIDAGLCSRRNRLEVASAWSKTDLPRPATLVAFSEETANQAAAGVTYPCTLFPMNTGKASTPLLDDDTADAVIEHRVVLGSDEEEIVLLQHGAPTIIYGIHVVDGEAIATDEEDVPSAAFDIAIRAAEAIEATLVHIDVAEIDSSLVAWDANCVADFRKAHQIGDRSMADAIAQLALRMSGQPSLTTGEEVHDVVTSR